MLRKLTDLDRDAAVSLLMQRPTHNLYLLSNMHQVGFDTDLCEFWGDFDENSGGDSGRCLRAVLNRYMTGWSVYGLPSASWTDLAAVVDGHDGVAFRLQDNPGGVESFVPYLEAYEAEKIREEELMKLAAHDFAPRPAPPEWSVRRAKWDDLQQLCSLYADAGSMTRSQQSIERPLRDLRIWVAVRNGCIFAAALTNAELTSRAMVGGVFTASDCRNLGLSQAVCSALCAELLSEGKQPVLYWQDPAAGAVYRRLGFVACGTWRSVWLRTR